MILTLDLSNNPDHKIEFFYNDVKKCITMEIVLTTSHGTFDSKIDIEDLEKFKKHLDYLYSQGVK